MNSLPSDKKGTKKKCEKDHQIGATTERGAFGLIEFVWHYVCLSFARRFFFGAVFLTLHKTLNRPWIPGVTAGIVFIVFDSFLLAREKSKRFYGFIPAREVREFVLNPASNGA